MKRMPCPRAGPDCEQRSHPAVAMRVRTIRLDQYDIWSDRYEAKVTVCSAMLGRIECLCYSQSGDQRPVHCYADYFSLPTQPAPLRFTATFPPSAGRRRWPRAADNYCGRCAACLRRPATSYTALLSSPAAALPLQADTASSLCTCHTAPHSLLLHVVRQGPSCRLSGCCAALPSAAAAAARVPHH